MTIHTNNLQHPKIHISDASALWLTEESGLTWLTRCMLIYKLDREFPYCRIVCSYSSDNIEDAHLFFETAKILFPQYKDIVVPEFMNTTVLHNSVRQSLLWHKPYGASP